MARKAKDDSPETPELAVKQAERVGQISKSIAGQKLPPLGKPRTTDERIAASERAHGTVTVEAMKLGEYLYKRRRLGDTFTIPAQRWEPAYTADEVEHFKLPETYLGKSNPKAGRLCYQGSWMEVVPDGTAIRETGANRAIDREREAIHGRGGSVPAIDQLAE